MSAGPVLDLWLANERIEGELREQRLRRLALAARGPRRASLRVSIGRHLIQIGHRLLADASRDVDSAVPVSTSPSQPVYSHVTTSHNITTGAGQ